MDKNIIRKNGISARNSLTAEERTAFSNKICSQIIDSNLFKHSETILIYKSIRSEVSLDALESFVSIYNNSLSSCCADTSEKDAAHTCKSLCYPYCVNESEMIALKPHNAASWARGKFGISEPQPDKSDLILPCNIDLVICPCTAFDIECHRMGMGAGYYDRFLAKCTKAIIIGAAFDCQKAKFVPTEAHDIALQAVFTENAVYHIMR